MPSSTASHEPAVVRIHGDGKVKSARAVVAVASQESVEMLGAADWVSSNAAGVAGGRGGGAATVAGGPLTRGTVAAMAPNSARTAHSPARRPPGAHLSYRLGRSPQ